MPGYLENRGIFAGDRVVPYLTDHDGSEVRRAVRSGVTHAVDSRNCAAFVNKEIGPGPSAINTAALDVLWATRTVPIFAGFPSLIEVPERRVMKSTRGSGCSRAS